MKSPPNVAHDLRIPLARLYQRLEGARLHARSLADYKAAVDGALADADALLATCSSLLRIAQVEGQAGTAPFTPLDVGEPAETVVDVYRADAETGGHGLHLAIGGPATMVGDRELLTQTMANLVENAIRHTPPGTRIDVSVDTSADRIDIVITDDGPGVPDTELPLLTRLFFRAEQSRTRAARVLVESPRRVKLLDKQRVKASSVTSYSRTML